MNRFLKKALSFLTAAAITVSCATASVSAAGSSKLTAKQVLANKYEMALGGSLFISKVNEKKIDDDNTELSIAPGAEIVKITSSGKAVKVPNTLGCYYTKLLGISC